MNYNCELVPFGKLFDWMAKSQIKSGSGKAIGKYKMFVCSDTDIKRYDEYLETEESLVFGTGGNASCHYVNEPFAYSTDCIVAQKKSDDVFTKFYYYFFRQNHLNLLQSTFTGSGLQHTSKTKIEKIIVPFISYEEQKRIVSKIEKLFSKLDKAVETLQTTKKQLAVYRQAVLVNALNGDFPKTSINDVCQAIVDCPHSTPKWVESGRICLRTTNFKRGFLDLSSPNYVSQETFDSRNARLVPKAGDVLYSREGSILGIACIIPNGKEVCLGQRMMLLRTSPKILNKLLMYYLNSPMVTNHVITSKGGTGSPHINVGDIKNYMVPVPDINQQIEIVNHIEERFSICNNIEQTITIALTQAEIMRQSILKKAFEGEL